MPLAVKTAPATEPVSLTEAKTFLNVTAADDDTLLMELIAAARQAAEGYTRRAFVDRTYTYSLDGFPLSSFAPIRLPFPPLSAVSSVKYLDTNGTQQTWSAALYDVDANEVANKARIMPAYSEDYPSHRRQIDSVLIEFVAGYGAAADVPEMAKIAIKNIVAEMFEFREPIIAGTMVTALPISTGIQRILNPLKAFD